MAPKQRSTAPLKPELINWLRPGTTGFALLILSLGLIAFAFTAVANHRAMTLALKHATARDQASETQFLVLQMYRLLVDMETGQRGFLLTGQDEFLDPYIVGKLKLTATQAMLSAQLEAATGQDSPTQKLDELVARRIELAQRSIEARRAQASKIAAQPTVLSGYVEGKALMDEIRDELDRLALEQRESIYAHHNEVYAVSLMSERLSVALPVIGTLFILFAVGRLIYERHRRDQAESSLRSMNATLETQVQHRTAQLQSALSRIRSFASELDASVENERRRLARELHDQFGQIATAIRMLVMGLRTREPPVAEPVVQELLELVDEAIGMARRISAALRPPLLDDLGLAAATEHFCCTIQRQSGLRVHCHVSGDDMLTPHQANQLFRVIQEATTNVLRHAHARELTILGGSEDHNYRVDVIDDGVGPGPVRIDASGIHNMRERAKLIGGELLFGPGDGGRGTRVSVVLPLLEHEESAQPQLIGGEV